MYSKPEQDILNKMKTTYISKRKEKEYLSSTNIILNKGRFNRKEDIIFHNTVLDFINENNLKLEDLKNSFTDKTTFPLRELATYIAQNLYFRTLYTVTYRLKRMYHPFYRKKWSHEEKMELLRFVAQNGKDWSKIKEKFNCELENARIVLRWLLKECQSKNTIKSDWSSIDEIKLLGFSLIYNFYSPNFILTRDFETILADLVNNKNSTSYDNPSKVKEQLKIYNDTGSEIDYDDIHFISITYKWPKDNFYTSKHLAAKFKISQNVYEFKTFKDIYDALVDLISQEAIKNENFKNFQIVKEKTNRSVKKK
ncbi:hypothetical protein DMUE_4993 [Dictyocoela muelleri]|nr:hypothetical protein DMUE_4993 [Dictyocoela muelleri]